MTENNKTIRIVLIGGSGYTGLETVRWLARHPQAELVGAFGRPDGTLGRLDEIFPSLGHVCTLSIEPFDLDAIAALQPDLAMLCVPHKVAMGYVPDLRRLGVRIIDWSADYRLTSLETYQQWYCPHTDADALATAAYGLPEFFAEDIAPAELVANPGCYPTCATLGLAPALQAGLVEPTGIIVNAVSGISGAGKSPKPNLHFPEANESFVPYATSGHRHQPEIEQNLSRLAGRPASVLFQPHLCPMTRGMLASMYATPIGDVTEQGFQEVYQQAYADKPFVRVRTAAALPDTKNVCDTNFCDVWATVRGGKVVVFSAIDNMTKGASTQAIQCMNLMFGLPETMGLL